MIVAVVVMVSSRTSAPAGLLKPRDNVLIGGFIVGTRVLIRAIGPSLKSKLPEALNDPTVEFYDQNGTAMEGNDNWKDSPRRSDIEPSGIAPTNDAESAILVNLTLAPYTAIVRGVNESTGLGLVEVYNLQ